MGAMRLKMTIFKWENSVCRVAFFLVRWWRLDEKFVLANEAIASFARTRNSHALALEVSVYLWSGGDPTKNCNFHRKKVGLLWSKNFKSCVPRKLLCKERLLTQPSLSFASYEMPTSVLCSKFIFCTTAIHVHRHPIALHFLVCRENCFANKDCSPNPPFPLHLLGLVG